MSVFFDSSVLVAAFLGDHEHHDASLEALLDTSARQLFCAAHSLAEVYAILTRLPGHHRVSPDHTLLFINEICQRFTLVELTAGQYQAVIATAARGDIVGGAIYDALILQCAIKAKAQSILTWNLRDFRRIAPHLADIIQTPGS